MIPARDERDEWLMAQVALGRREPLEPLVRRYAGPLTGFIRRLVRDEHLGEELFQEVFLLVWRKRGQYQFPRPFKPWLYAIALNKCRAVFRTAAGRAPPKTLEHGVDIAGPHTDSPDAPAIATETTALVARAVERLPPKQREVVALRVWDELSYADIAEIVGCSEATARSHMHHGLAAVRAALEPYVS